MCRSAQQQRVHSPTPAPDPGLGTLILWLWLVSCRNLQAKAVWCRVDLQEGDRAAAGGATASNHLTWSLLWTTQDVQMKWDDADCLAKWWGTDMWLISRVRPVQAVSFHEILSWTQLYFFFSGKLPSTTPGIFHTFFDGFPKLLVLTILIVFK